MAPDELEQIKRRRRAIKLSAGVSTIFTLASGSALAATSATCDEKPGNSMVLESPPDGTERPTTVVDEDAREYIYDSSGLDGDRYVTASCWTSINASQAAGGASSRIV